MAIAPNGGGSVLAVVRGFFLDSNHQLTLRSRISVLSTRTIFGFVELSVGCRLRHFERKAVRFSRETVRVC